MVSVCVPSDALLQHLPSYLGFSYLGHGVSLHSCSSKVQPLLLTLDEGYLLMAAPPDLERGVAPFSPPHAAAAPGRGIAPLGCCPWPRACGSSSWPRLWPRSLALWVATPDLGRGVAPLSHTSACCKHQKQKSTAYKECVCKSLLYQNERYGDLFGNVVGNKSR